MIDRIDGDGWNSTIENSGTPIVELPASTPRNEARIAMAVVAELRDRGVPTRDILVTIREVEQYENSLVERLSSVELLRRSGRSSPLLTPNRTRCVRKAVCSLMRMK